MLYCILSECFSHWKINSQSTPLFSQCTWFSIFLVAQCMYCVSVHARRIFFLIVNDGKAPQATLKRLSKKSLTAASRRNSEMPNQHFVIGIRKLHPLCNNMFLFGAVPNGSLPVQTWQADQMILYKNTRTRKTIIICLVRSGCYTAHKYKWDVTYTTNLVIVTSLRKSFWGISLNYSFSLSHISTHLVAPLTR